MRRMLDPKELDVGNKIYKHTINLWSSTYGVVYLTIYNTSNEKISSESQFNHAMEKFGDTMASGYISDAQFYYNVYHANWNDSNKKVRAIGYRVKSDGKMTTWATELDYRFSIENDDVKEIR